MEIFYISLLIVVASIISIIGFFILIFSIHSFYSIFTTKVPWAKIPKENIDIILENCHKSNGPLLYDLGCGDGQFLFKAEKKGYRVIGYELYIYPFLKAKLKKFINNSEATILRKNFFKTDLSNASVVFVFLVDKMMEKVKDKLKQDLKNGTLVISYGFELPGMISHKIIDTKPSKTYFYII